MAPKKTRQSMRRTWAMNARRNRRLEIVWRTTQAAENRCSAQIARTAVRAGFYAPGRGRVANVPESLKWMQ